MSAPILHNICNTYHPYLDYNPIAIGRRATSGQILKRRFPSSSSPDRQQGELGINDELHSMNRGGPSTPLVRSTYAVFQLTLYTLYTLWCPKVHIVFHKAIINYMGGLILGVNTLYRLFCFFKLFIIKDGRAKQHLSIRIPN